MKNHGGQITVRSDPGKGTTFRVDININYQFTILFRFFSSKKYFFTNIFYPNQHRYS
ncbi:MAG: hypothetical protein ACQERV_12050 [Bacteroidota bacterium]